MNDKFDVEDYREEIRVNERVVLTCFISISKTLQARYWPKPISLYPSVSLPQKESTLRLHWTMALRAIFGTSRCALVQGEGRVSTEYEYIAGLSSRLP